MGHLSFYATPSCPKAPISVTWTKLAELMSHEKTFLGVAPLVIGTCKDRELED